MNMLFRSILITLIFFFSWLVKAQVPNKINFQTVVRYNSGKLVSSKTVGVKFSVLKAISSGTAVYVETHTSSTDVNGLLNIMIGNGTPSQGLFSAINWIQGPYYLKSEIDLTGGSNYILNGVTEFLSVTYAMKVMSSDSTSYTSNVKTLSKGDTIGDMNYWNGSSWAPMKRGLQDHKLTFCNNQPTWAYKGVCLGTITTINCSGASQTGSLIKNTVANAQVLIPYSANGGSYISNKINSTGVLGLVASIEQGILANGTGSLMVKISGTPTTNGTAFFEVNVAGKTCLLSRTVNAAQ